mgnify:CR=1 FL=1
MSFQKIKSSTSRRFDISTAALHIIAMLFMLMDHLWATLLPAQEWLTWQDRISDFCIYVGRRLFSYP